MIYKPEHVVDLEAGAIVDVALNPGDQRDAQGLAARVVAAAARATVAVGEVARVETVVADMGYCDAAELGTLQAAGIRTAIADPVRNRRLEKLPAAARRALRRAKRTTRSRSGRALMRRRGELGERSFVHVLDYGGARRTPLRGGENILKRYRIQTARAPAAARGRDWDADAGLGGLAAGPARSFAPHPDPAGSPPHHTATDKLSAVAS